MTTEYLLRREMEHVFAGLTPANRLGCRVCAQKGLRVCDVLELRTEQLRPQMWVTERKTKKRKRVNLPKLLYEELRRNAGRVWVFTSPKDWRKHRTRQAVWMDVKRAARAFRLPQNVGVHSLRKRYAVEQVEQGRGNFVRVQKLLNHADLATTMVYALSYELYKRKYGKTE